MAKQPAKKRFAVRAKVRILRPGINGVVTLITLTQGVPRLNVQEAS
jgi:hypothetical protein